MQTHKTYYKPILSGHTKVKRLWQISLLLCLILLFEAMPGCCQSGLSRYEHIKEVVNTLYASPNVGPIEYGKSYEGWQIPAFVITDFPSGLKGKSRIFICSGQHGTEYSPITSILDMCEALANSDNNDILKKCAIIVVPVANPDGIVATERENGQGLDINRDWEYLTTPETRYIHSIIKDWRPHLLLDIHEWTEPTTIPGNSIELARCATEDQEIEMSKLALEAGQASKMTLIRCSRDSNTGLFHRRYSSLGYAAFLLETEYGLPIEEKDRKYKNTILSILESIASGKINTQRLSPASAGFDVAAATAALKPKAESSPVVHPATIFYAVVAGCILYSAIVWLKKPCSKKHRTVISKTIKEEKTPEVIQKLTVDLPEPPPDHLSMRTLLNRDLRRTHEQEMRERQTRRSA